MNILEFLIAFLKIKIFALKWTDKLANLDFRWNPFFKCREHRMHFERIEFLCICVQKMRDQIRERKFFQAVKKGGIVGTPNRAFFIFEDAIGGSISKESYLRISKWRDINETSPIDLRTQKHITIHPRTDGSKATIYWVKNRQVSEGVWNRSKVTVSAISPFEAPLPVPA
jgi:hypothetical protein